MHMHYKLVQEEPQNHDKAISDTTRHTNLLSQLCHLILPQPLTILAIFASPNISDHHLYHPGIQLTAASCSHLPSSSLILNFFKSPTPILFIQPHHKSPLLLKSKQACQLSLVTPSYCEYHKFGTSFAGKRRMSSDAFLNFL